MKTKKSKLGKLDFIEEFLYEKPDGNYFRGISVDFKGMLFLSISLTTNESDPDYWKSRNQEPTWLRIDKRGLIDRGQLYTCPSGTQILYPLIIQRYFKLEDIEACKQECVEIFDRYVKFFTE
jgi:hypothetical protein